MDNNEQGQENDILEQGKNPLSKVVLEITNRAKNIETRYELEEGKEIIVGADPQCSVFVDDEYISFRHFSVKAQNGRFEVKDLGSRNGLFLKVESYELIPGQSLLAGKTLFKIEESDV